MAERPASTGPTNGPQPVEARPAAPAVGSLWPAATSTRATSTPAADPAATATPAVPAAAAPTPAPGPAHAEPVEEGPGRMVRPYALTGGRTRSKGTELAIEAMVTTTPQGHAASGLAWERRKIVELCSSPQSIAEVSAHLSIPLGVARVLVGDLAAEGLLAVNGAGASVASDVSLLERVLHGLRAL